LGKVEWHGLTDVFIVDSIDDKSLPGCLQPATRRCSCIAAIDPAWPDSVREAVCWSPYLAAKKIEELLDEPERVFKVLLTRRLEDGSAIKVNCFQG
jgi:hypothetical protein